MLHAQMGDVRDGLADLAQVCWMMSLPERQDAYSGHPAGRGRAGMPADGGPGLVAVTFGDITTGTGPGASCVLPVSWEPAEAGSEGIAAADGSITVSGRAPAGSVALTLDGDCQTPPGGLTAAGYEQAGLAATEAARELIVGVARAVTLYADPEAGREALGPAWAWVSP